MMQPVGKQRDAQIHRAPLRLVHRHPSGYLVESAQATAAYIVAQRGGAMPCAGSFGGDFGVSGGRRQKHDAAIIQTDAQRAAARSSKRLQQFDKVALGLKAHAQFIQIIVPVRGVQQWKQFVQIA